MERYLAILITWSICEIALASRFLLQTNTTREACQWPKKFCLLPKQNWKKLWRSILPPSTFTTNKLFAATPVAFWLLFSWAPYFKEFFAVKANPNPVLLQILKEEGFGADCSSLAELMLAQMAGISGECIMFSAGNRLPREYREARNMGAIINLDDITHIDYLEKHASLADILSFRYNPGPLVANGNPIIGVPGKCQIRKLTKDQLFEAYQIVLNKGVREFWPTHHDHFQ